MPPTPQGQREYCPGGSGTTGAKVSFSPGTTVFCPGYNLALLSYTKMVKISAIRSFFAAKTSLKCACGGSSASDFTRGAYDGSYEIYFLQILNLCSKFRAVIIIIIVTGKSHFLLISPFSAPPKFAPPFSDTPLNFALYFGIFPSILVHFSPSYSVSKFPSFPILRELISRGSKVISGPHGYKLSCLQLPQESSLGVLDDRFVSNTSRA